MHVYAQGFDIAYSKFVACLTARVASGDTVKQGGCGKACRVLVDMSICF